MLSWADVSPALSSAITLTELGVDDGGAMAADAQSQWPASRVHVACQPAPAFHGRIADWIADVKQALAHGDTVIVVASTHGRAERTVELLHDYEVRAVRSATVGDLVAGAVFVEIGRASCRERV